MSTTDVLHPCRTVVSPVLIPMPDFTPLRDGLARLATHLLDRFQRYLAMQRIARLSDNQLGDIGFERDWDGSILPRRR